MEDTYRVEPLIEQLLSTPELEPPWGSRFGPVSDVNVVSELSSASGKVCLSSVSIIRVNREI